MGKKKQKHFKKNNSAVATTPTIADLSADNVDNIESRRFEIPLKVQEQTIDEKYAYVRKDVRKLMFTLAAMVVLFVGFFILRGKTTILTTVGDWIYKVSNFQV